MNYKNNFRHKKTWIPYLETHYLPNYTTLIGRLLMMLVITAATIPAAPHNTPISARTLNQADWPGLVHHDIWGDENQKFQRTSKNRVVYDEDDDQDDYEAKEVTFESDPFIQLNLNGNIEDKSQQFSINSQRESDAINSSRRQSKVIHLFPVPVDGECLSNDGRRSGTCYNAYECRNKGGQAKGDCALGFGVCCIFIADCNVTISNNITYLVSPGFPSFMPNNVTNCNLKIKILHDDISQLRFDFNHFVLGQPNRRTGVCDGDLFEVSGGPAGPFLLCGQNSGQHMYYDVGDRMLPRQTLYGTLRPLQYKDLYPGRNTTADSANEIVLNLNFAARYLPTRLWEIRITQIPFSQRAPAGCLQYFSGTEGIFQTYNFADNGRHLANHNYRICMRQEMDMCSIVYQPCDEQSFRIGPSSANGMVTSNNNGQFGGMAGGIFNTDDGSIQMDGTNNRPSMDQVLADDSGSMQLAMTTATATTGTASTIQETTSTATTRTTITTITEGTSSTATAPSSTTTPTVAQTSSVSTPAVDSIADEAQSTSSVVSSTTSSTTDVSSSSTPLSDDVEGSGGDEDDDLRYRPTPGSSSQVSRRPRPTRGGFDLLGFLRSAFDLGFRSKRQDTTLRSNRQKRQFFSSCRDRITMPCIVEDFIDSGLGPLPGCEPVHCGMQFCSNGKWPCRVESTVTPFYVSIHFGDGSGKGSAEDNIGACLKYQQIQCMR